MNDYPNTHTCFPAICTITHLFSWETYIVKKLVIQTPTEGKKCHYGIIRTDSGGKRWDYVVNSGRKKCEKGLSPI